MAIFDEFEKQMKEKKGPLYENEKRIRHQKRGGSFVNVPRMLFNDVLYSVSDRALQLIMYFFTLTTLTTRSKGTNQGSFTKDDLQKKIKMNDRAYRRARKELEEAHFITTGSVGTYHEKTLFHVYNDGNSKDHIVTYVRFPLAKIEHEGKGAIYTNDTQPIGISQAADKIGHERKGVIVFDGPTKGTEYKIGWYVADNKPYKEILLDTPEGYRVIGVTVYDITGEGLNSTINAWLRHLCGQVTVKQDRFVVTGILNASHLILHRNEKKVIEPKHAIMFYKVFFKKNA